MKRIDHSRTRTIYYHREWVAFRHSIIKDSWVFRHVIGGTLVIVEDVPLRRLRNAFSALLKMNAGKDTAATRWLNKHILRTA